MFNNEFTAEYAQGSFKQTYYSMSTLFSVNLFREISTLLEGWHVVLDLDNRESSFKERQKIKNEILDNGGLLGFSVSKKVCFLINIGQVLLTAAV